MLPRQDTGRLWALLAVFWASELPFEWRRKRRECEHVGGRGKCKGRSHWGTHDCFIQDVSVCLRVCVCVSADMCVQGACSGWCSVCVCVPQASGPSAKSSNPVPSRAGPGPQVYKTLVLKGSSSSPAPYHTAEEAEALALDLSEPQILQQFKPSLIIPAWPAS